MIVPDQSTYFMTKENCLAWLNVTIKELHSGKHEKIGTDYTAIANLFSEYDEDQDGRLTKSDFLTFYTQQSKAKPEVVW